MGGTYGWSVRKGMLLPGEGEDPRAVGGGAALQDINMMAGVVRRAHVWGARRVGL